MCMAVRRDDLSALANPIDADAEQRFVDACSVSLGSLANNVKERNTTYQL